MLSSLSFRVNLPTTFTFLSVFEQVLRLPPCIRTEACFLAVRSPSPNPDACELFEAGCQSSPLQLMVNLAASCTLQSAAVLRGA